jgi:aspartyl-tRNA synthetase
MQKEDKHSLNPVSQIFGQSTNQSNSKDPQDPNSSENLSGSLSHNLSQTVGNNLIKNTQNHVVQNRYSRSHYCGQVKVDLRGQNISLCGWVNQVRNHGGLVFMDLRDRTGVVQIVFDPKTLPESQNLRCEDVVRVLGEVVKRPPELVNKKIATGEIEVKATELQVLSRSEVLPFQIGDESVAEALRLKYRFLDLRSERMMKNLKLRHRVLQLTRNYFSDQGFLEIETPILYKTTPEGARDYLVPSRVEKGSVYALPQSPQTFKQLLMISGYDKYFQIARCFRDEDLRSDRQPEFTQIDVEMSFIDREDILQVNEGLAQKLWKEILFMDIGPIPRISFSEAMERYGNDKPDLRFGMELQDLTEVVRPMNCKVFAEALIQGVSTVKSVSRGVVKGIVVPGCGSYSRSQIDKIIERAQKLGARGLVWIKKDAAGGLASSLAKILEPKDLEVIWKSLGASDSDLALVVADRFDRVSQVLSSLRLYFGKELRLYEDHEFRFCWIVDFPLFEYSEEERRWVARHHPFTSPQEEYFEALKAGDVSSYGEMKAKAYDLVCNGHEIAGGSIRIFRNDLQAAMFRALGLSDEEAHLKFGFLLEALKYGTPPHGGIAWGLDRLVMILAGTEAIREVIAFPKTVQGFDLMVGCPSPFPAERMVELGLFFRPTT